MILIADSGSTKTDWRLVRDNHDIVPLKCMGFNPYFQDTPTISNELKEKVVPSLQPEKISAVYFYGAGCSSDSKCEVVEKAIRENFPNAEIEVDHDLLGAARAICGHEEGIAAILGTGSNACYYDGKFIREQLFSLGYMLGDEGSGGNMGKRLITRYLSDILDPHLTELFREKYPYTKEEILETIYKKPLPNRFLASFSTFVKDHINHPEMEKIVRDSFSDFYDNQVLRFKKAKEVPMSCVGSVGFYFADLLREVGKEKGVMVKNIAETPIAKLTEYHLNNQP